jgi:hypothetical protein
MLSPTATGRKTLTAKSEIQMSNLRLTILLCLLSTLWVQPTARSYQTKTADGQQSTDAMKQSMELTVGEKKAVELSDKLKANTVAVFDKEGNLKANEKVDPANWETLTEYAKKTCSNPAPISPKCVRCKGGEILCAYVPKKRQKQDQ